MASKRSREDPGRSQPGRQQAEIRVLGPIEVLIAGRRVELGGPRERAVLTVLVARGPSPVRSEQLIDDIWGEDPPPGALLTLRSYVSTLRRTLRANGVENVIITSSGGYSVPDRDGLVVDVRLFESLVTESRRHHGLQPTSESAMLRSALSLWQGAALADAACTVDIAALVSRLEELQLVALERWANADLLCRRHVDLAAELEPWCRANPFRERLWGLYMISLYRSGRQAEALKAFEEVRGRMVERLGLEPGPELRRIESAILRHDATLEGTEALGSTRTGAWIELPVHLKNPTIGVFVGRRAELTTLDRCWFMTITGSPSLAVVAGEAGIGKTRLLSTWAAKIHDHGVTVIYGRCDEEASGPYQPILDALRPLLLAIPAGERRVLVSSVTAQHLRSVLPELAYGSDDGPDTASLGPDSDRDHLFSAFKEVLTALGDRSPLVVVIDDVHRAGRSTLQLIQYLADHLGPRSPMLVVTARNEDSDAGSSEGSAVDFLMSSTSVTHLQLQGLSVDDVSTLVDEALLDRSHLAELTEVVFRSSAGNPLFVRQILAHLSAEPEAFFNEDGTIRPQVPSVGLQEVIERRLRPLPDDQVEVLRVAAAVGVEFDLNHVELILPDHDVLAAVEAGERAGLVEELDLPEHFSFTHATIRAALYNQMSSARRIRLHRHLGEALESSVGSFPSNVEILAHHFLAGARPSQTAKGVSYALAAGRQALDRLAFERAVELAQRGLDCLSLDAVLDRELRCRLRLLLAEGHLYGRDSRSCRRAALLAAEDARVISSPTLLAEAAIVGTELGILGEAEDDIARLCEDALAALEPLEENAPLSGLVLNGLAKEMHGLEGGTNTEPLYRQAIQLCRTSGDPSTLVQPIFAYSLILEWTPRIRDRISLAQDLIALGRKERDVRAEAYGYHIRALALLAMGDMRGFETDARRVDGLLLRVADWFLELYKDLWQGMRALLDGRFEDVEAAGEALLTRGHHDPNVVNAYFSQFCWLRREQGTFDEVLSVLSYAVEQSPFMPVFRCGLAVTYIDMGDLDRARRELDRLARDSFGDLTRDTTYTTSLTVLAEVVTRLGDVGRAEILYNLLAPYSGLLIVATQGAVCLGAADRYLGMLAATAGRHDRASALFGAAASLEDRADTPRLADRTREWSSRLVRAGRTGGEIIVDGPHNADYTAEV